MKKITLLLIALMCFTFGQSQNLALGGVTDSSTGDSTLAVDGNGATRWESAFNDAEWWSVDLGASYDIAQVLITWEGAYGSAYTIEISPDNMVWTTIYTEAAGDGGTDNLTVSGTGRYIRYNGTARGTVYGHSFYEFEVYEAVSSMEDATLSDLQVDAFSVSGFSSILEDYTYTVPDGTVVVPTVTATTTEGGANAVVTPAASLPGNTTVVVTAEDGTTTKTYTISFEFPVAFPFDFETSQPFVSAGDEVGLSVIDDGSGTNNVLQLVGGVADWDSANVAFATPIDLSDDANNTLRFTFQSTTADPAEVHQHGISFQTDGQPSYEVNFQTTGQDPIDVELDFGAGLGSRDRMHIFIDVGDLGAIQASPNVNGTDTKALSGTYIIDNITLGATILSVNDFEALKFSVYPNPTQGNWTVKSKNENITAIRVFDVLGKQVLFKSVDSREITIDGSSLRTGLYFAQIKTNNGTRSLKLVKK